MRGFTLIETLVYLALFAIMIGGIVSAAYLLFETNDRNQTKAMLQEEKNFVVSKINWALNGVNPALSITPAANTSAATLVVTKYNGTTVTINPSGSTVTFNGTALNNSNVTISKLVFIHTYAGGTNPESIEAGFTITTRTPEGATISQIASTTSYIRK
jgi:Tfp pilus assembly protein PilE